MDSYNFIEPIEYILPYLKGSVWEEFGKLNEIYKPQANLGPGFPNWELPSFIGEQIVSAVQGITSEGSIDNLYNQYTTTRGHIILLEALVKLYTPIVGRELTINNFTISNGACQAITSTMSTFLRPDDEVIIFTPFWPAYEGAIYSTGAKIIRIPLELNYTNSTMKSSDFGFSRNMFSNAISNKTRMVLINTPHNPTGKIFSEEELKFIAKITEPYNRILFLIDEVYEFLTYETEIVRMNKILGMWERTISVSSAAKTFSVTGWKVGWSNGPEDLILAIKTRNTFINTTVCTPMQIAVGRSIEIALENDFFLTLTREYKIRRNIITDALEEGGFKYLLPDATFYCIIDIKDIDFPEDFGRDHSAKNLSLDKRDWNFARWLLIEKGICGIPISSFYGTELDKSCSTHFIRLAFCKDLETLEKAAQILKEFMIK